MNEYELMTILSPRLNADETAATVHAIEARIAQHSGELLATDVWGRRRLAYPIGESMEGTYVLTTLRLPAASAAPLESWLTLSESVIRHLLIRGIIPYAGHDRERERDAERERERDAEPASARVVPAVRVLGSLGARAARVM